MTKLKLRGIVGNLIMFVFSTLGLALMALPMYQTITNLVGENKTIYSSSVFEYMGYFGDKSMTQNHTIALVFFLLFAIVAAVVMVLSIVGLVGAILGNKKLNMAIVNQALSVALVVLGLLGLIFTVVYISNDIKFITDDIKNGACAGSILPMCMAIFGTVGAFVVPANKKAKK